jgi:hypothetical protein
MCFLAVFVFTVSSDACPALPPPRPAQDEGGVTKEFFQLLSRELFRPEFGMFLPCPDPARAIWLSPDSLEGEPEFALGGALLGLAIYNGVLLDVHLPGVLYKALLGGAPELKVGGGPGSRVGGFKELGC